MAGVERLELPTIGFGDRCSTNWNYTPATDSNYTDAQPKVKVKLLINLSCSVVWRFNKQRKQRASTIIVAKPETVLIGLFLSFHKI